MTKITAPQNYENSPKQQFLKDWNIALAEQNREVLAQGLTDDVDLSIVGSGSVQGKERVIDAMIQEPLKEFVIEGIITHGREGVVYGELHGDGYLFAFSDLYIFEDAKGNKIKSIRAYQLELKDE